MVARKAHTGSSQRLSRRARAAVPTQMRARAAAGLEARKGSLVRELQGVAAVLRRATEELEEREQMTMARYAQRAADAVERAGEALDRKSVSEIGAEIGRVCRERPVLVGAAAAAVGFVAARYARNAASRGSSKSSAVPIGRASARSA